MSLFNLALAYLWHRRLVSVLCMLSVALGVGLIVAVISVRQGVERAFLNQATEYDLIAGPSGSEAALVLSSLYFADQPRGNIPLTTFLQLQAQAGVLAAYPLALGDSYRGSRIVGVAPEMFAAKESGLRIKDGRLFDKDFELVVGSEAARRHGLKLGAKVIGSHGARGDEHREFPYTVVGTLEPTGSPRDRAMFASLGSYWQIHEQRTPAQQEVTAVLLQTAKPQLLQLQYLLPRKFAVAVVRPAEVLERVFRDVLAPVEQLLLTFGSAVAGAAGASIISTLYLSTLVRRRDLAILRALGATPMEVFTLVVLEAFALLVVGSALGLIGGHQAILGFRGDVEGRFGVAIEAFRFAPAEVFSILAIILLGLLASILPARHAYKSDVASALARG